MRHMLDFPPGNNRRNDKTWLYSYVAEREYFSRHRLVSSRNSFHRGYFLLVRSHKSHHKWIGEQNGVGNHDSLAVWSADHGCARLDIFDFSPKLHLSMYRPIMEVSIIYNTMHAGGFEPHKTRSKKDKKVRYAELGLGYISQIAVLPAFEHTGENFQGGRNATIR